MFSWMYFCQRTFYEREEAFSFDDFLPPCEEFCWFEQVLEQLKEIQSEFFKIEQQIFFNDPATTFMERIIELHHEIFFYLIILSFLVFWLLFRINYLCKHNRYTWVFLYGSESNLLDNTQNTKLEIIWTIIPCLLLSLIAFPSLTLIFSYQPIIKSNMVFKVIGNQWWWAYEYEKFKNYTLKNFSFFTYYFYDSILTQEDFQNHNGYMAETFNSETERILHLDSDPADFEITVKFFCFEKKIETHFIESRLIDTEDLEKGEFRLLEVTSKLFIPRNIQITALVTSNDVLHSWAVPSLGIKIDACPGRLNEIKFLIYRNGLFFGQCSEICGILHGFMPIVIQSMSYSDILTLIDNIKIDQSFYLRIFD